MTIESIIDCDNVGEGIQEGRALHPARAFRFQFAQDNLDFRLIEVADPMPLGRQILSAAGLRSGPEYSLFAILESGEFEDVRLDEPFDLRGRGAERFIAFQTDREFKLTVNGNGVRWGKPVISERVLRQIANPGKNQSIFLVVDGGQDRELDPNELINLATPGIERFISAPRAPRTIKIIVNGREEEVVEAHQTFDALVALAFPGKPPAPNTTYSITFRKAASKPHSGELGQGGSIEVKNGTQINVACTVQS